MAAHEQELENLTERMDSERARQQLALRDKLSAQRRRKMDELRRKQEVELTKEMIEQRKEVDDIRTEQNKEVERSAIQEGIRENGDEDSGKVVRAVLASRHAQELQDLDKRFAAEKKVMVDDAVSQLHLKYDKQRDGMLKRHAEELAALQKKGLSPEELQLQRSALMESHQSELTELDRDLAGEEREIEMGALTDWEVRLARAKLELKEKHYKEMAAALREFCPSQENGENAEAVAAEIEEVKTRLDQERQEQEKRLRKERHEFEKALKKRQEEEMQAYSTQLEQETMREKDKHDRNIESLNKRKEELIRERKQKIQDEVLKMKQQGASEDEQKRVMEQHERDLQNLLNKMEADRLRMQSNLQERLKKRREEKLRSKEKEVKEGVREEKKELEAKQRSERERLKADEALTLQETLNTSGVGTVFQREDTATTFGQRPPVSVTADTPFTPEWEGTPLPPSYSMAAPMDEAELMALLMASPLYQKLEQIKGAVAARSFGGHKMEPGEGYLDARESEWSKDTELQPVDLNKLNARTFIVYKFGCFVADLVASRCRHAPISILLAEKIPSNSQLARNQYRNSFHFDAGNRILYMRCARLDAVGEFIVVLVHCMAHIKAGDLRDDRNQDFIREYQRALAVVCDDLFFARYRRSTKLSQSLAQTGGADVEQAALKLLQAAFGACHTEDEKIQMVDELLDVKLLPGTNMEGVRFNRDRIKERLGKYSSFSMTNKLHSLLGRMEDKLQQSRAQGTSPDALQQLSSLSQKYTTAGTTVLGRQPPPSFVMANMTGHALWQTFVNQTGEKTDSVPVGAETEVSLQDRYDDLCSDFAVVNRNILDLKDEIRELEEEVSAETDLVERFAWKDSKDKQRHVKLLKTASKKLSKARSDATHMEMEKTQIMDKMSECEGKLGSGRHSPQGEEETSQVETSGGKSGKKSKK